MVNAGLPRPSIGMIWRPFGLAWPAGMPDIRFRRTDGALCQYLDRQRADNDAFRRDETLALPGDMEYLALSMAWDAAKLAAARPIALSGRRLNSMTPAALTLLLHRTRKQLFQTANNPERRKVRPNLSCFT